MPLLSPHSQLKLDMAFTPGCPGAALHLPVKQAALLLQIHLELIRFQCFTAAFANTAPES